MVQNDDKGGEYRWGLAWATAALLTFGVVLLFFPHARWFGIVILGGYLLLVKNSLHRVSWSGGPRATTPAKNRFARRRASEEEREAE